MSSASVRVGGLCVGVIAALSGATQAQWTATVLTPSGTNDARAFFTAGGRQAGWTRASDGAAHASVWSGSAASMVDLHPAGALGSSVAAIDGNQQVGNISLPPTWSSSVHAVVWNGSAASMVDLHPAGTRGSEVAAARGGRQVGFAWVSSADGTITSKHASLWMGTASSWVDLHPESAESSRLLDVRGGQQVGVTVISGQDRAGLWSGTVDSWVDLHPVGAAESSTASFIDGTLQAGEAVVATREHASVWSGTAASWVDLHPAGALYSSITGADGGRQGGSASFPAFVTPPFPPYMPRASLWSGTAASRVELHPAGALSSVVLAMDGEYQVGYATFQQPLTANPVPAHAGVWSGTAESWVDLSLVLPPYGGTTASWYETYATSVWSDGVTLYVSGYGENWAVSGTHALLWTRPLCGTSDFNGDGEFGTDADIEAFFACLAGNCCGSCFARGVDFNGDGDFGTDADIESFFRVLGGGPC